jgi:hypothetical protein
MTKISPFSYTPPDPVIRKGFIPKPAGPDSLYVQDQLDRMINEHGGKQEIATVTYEEDKVRGDHLNEITMTDGYKICYYEMSVHSDQPSIRVFDVKNKGIGPNYYTTGRIYGDCLIGNHDNLAPSIPDREEPEEDICPS